MGEMMSKTVKLENGHTITFDEDKHVYIHNNEYVVGMSTLLGKLASPALEAWKVNTQVNKLIELWLKGEKVTKPEDKVVANCFMQFQKFWKKHKLKLVESEKILYSLRGYCGTLDIIAIDPDGNICNRYKNI